MLAFFRKNGIAPRHITKLIPVSRATASAWLNGRTQPNGISQRELWKVQLAIRIARAEKKLPVPRSLKGVHADKYLVEILAELLSRASKQEC